MPELDPPGEDPLASLREHVRHAHAAAERLAFHAGGPVGPGGGEAPSAGGPAPVGGPPPVGGGPADTRDPEAPPESGPGAPSGSQTPPSGWAAPEPARELGGELRALVELVESLRALLPVELREQLNEIIRQVLLLARAVIDWLVERMQREPPQTAAEVQDIPIR